ncbi:MAG: hypothetical protein KAJ55_14235, partial [Anaerolineales bacterium]|nr:hypothetical protein [Anaerolineales bacterium]
MQENNGDAGTVEININNSDLPSTPVALHMFVDTDGDHDFTTGSPTQVAMTQTLGVWEATYNFNDGDYFTFAAEVPTLRLWLKADDDVYSDAGSTLATNGTDNVQEWHDQSGNIAFSGNQPTETSSGDKASYVTNGVNFNPTLLFEGSNDRLRTGSQINSNTIRDVTGENVSAYLVGNSTLAENNIFFDHGGSGAGNFNMGSQRLALGQSTNLSFSTDVDTQFRIITGIRAGSGTSNAYLDGAANGSITDSDASAVDYLFRIGINDVGTNDLEGNISEIIIYSDGHSATDKQKIESYLALKYGITLDQTSGQDYLASNGSTEMWNKDATGASTYDNDIAGIGRDDNSELGQVKSKSVN